MGLYEIAGLTVQMHVTGRTLAQAAPYACSQDGPVDGVIDCPVQQIMECNPHLTDPDLAEYLGTGAGFARLLLQHRGFQLHASAVALEGKGYLFTGPCGMGKSTHARKWCRLLGATPVNDDKPALRRLESGWMVWGTPWSGKHDVSSPIHVPVQAVACLRQAEENRITRLSPQEALPYIMSQCIRQLNVSQMDLQLELVNQFLQEIPIYLLECNLEDGAVAVSHGAMGEVAG